MIACLWFATIPLSPYFYLKAFGCHLCVCVGWWDLPPKLGLRGQLGGQKWYRRIARPWFAKTPRDHLNISNRFRVISLHHFVTHIHTHTHTHIHLHTRKMSIALRLSQEIGKKKLHYVYYTSFLPCVFQLPMMTSQVTSVLRPLAAIFMRES